jgi:hypothetical protein
MAQEDEFHRVRTTALHGQGVVVVAPVCRHGGAFCYLCHLQLIVYLPHGDPPVPFAGPSPTRLNAS